ncbi:MAG: hypothetical protein AAF600_14410 [Bacteroidota bacterium]
MEVNRDLLKRYANGQCRTEEKKHVEDWLLEQDFISGSFDQARIRKELNLSWVAIESHMEKEVRTKIIPLYTKFTRYAAAACLAIVIFFAGRYSTSLEENQLASQEKTPEEQGLMVYGGNGAFTQLNGDSFNLNFDGSLKVYNRSGEQKTIVVGNVTYTLEPNKKYYLLGNANSSSLIVSNRQLNDFNPLVGDFDIFIIRS